MRRGVVSEIGSFVRNCSPSHPWAQVREFTSTTPSHGPPYQEREVPGGPFVSLYNGGAALEGGASHPLVRRGATAGLEFSCRGARVQVCTFPQPPQGPGLQAP